MKLKPAQILDPHFPGPPHVPHPGEGTVTVFGQRAFVMGKDGYGVVDLPATGNAVTTAKVTLPPGTWARPISEDRMLTWKDGEMSLCPVGAGPALATAKMAQEPLCAALSPDGRLLATGDAAAVQEWKVPKLKAVASHPLKSPRDVAYSLAGTELHALGEDHVAWRPCEAPRLFETYASFTYRLYFPRSPRAEVVRFRLGGFDGVDSTTGEPLYCSGIRFGNHTAYVPGLHVSASASSAGSLRTETTELRDVTTGRLRAKPLPHSGRLYGLGVTNDARWLVAAVNNHKIELWDLTKFVTSVLHTSPVAPQPAAVPGRRMGARLNKVSSAVAAFLFRADVFRDPRPGVSTSELVIANIDAGKLWKGYLQRYGAPGVPNLLSVLPQPRDTFDRSALFVFAFCETLAWALEKPREDRRQAVAAVLQHVRKPGTVDVYRARINATLGAVDETLAPEPYLWTMVSAFNAIERIRRPDDDSVSYLGFIATSKSLPYPGD